MAADRERYAERQAELLRSLVGGEDFPAGFAAEDAAAASRSLRRKRAHAVRKAWPALALEPHFDERFDAFARAVAAPAIGDALADGLAFTRTVAPDQLSDDARVERLLARAQLTGGPAAPRRRRGPFLGAVLLRDPRRLLIVTRLLGGRVLARPLGPPGA